MNVDVEIVIDGVDMDIYPLTERAISILDAIFSGYYEDTGYCYPNYTIAKGSVVNILTREGLTYSEVDMSC